MTPDTPANKPDETLALSPECARDSQYAVLNQSPIFADYNLFVADRALCEALEREGAGWAQGDLTALGARAGSAEVLEWGRTANHYTPVLRRFDEKGNRLDRVDYHPSYHQVMHLSCSHGLHCAPWEHLPSASDTTESRPKPRSGRITARCAGLYLMAQAESGHCCPITMTNAAIPVIRQNPALARKWLPKLLIRDYDPAFRPFAQKRAATIGMGMTERQGGTDVRANITCAEPGGAGDAHLITGHKWFMSAPMCDAFLILAQAKGGLSCFFVPRFLDDGRLNGLHFERLKDKLGNRSNASSEVVFDRALGWLIGEEGRGVPTIIEMVTYTRLDCAVASAGLMRLGIANAVHHARYRSVMQKKLIDQPLMARVLADLALDVEAATALAVRLAGSFDRVADAGEGGSAPGEDSEDEAAYRRLMTPVTKYWICKTAPRFLYEAMECLGGNGYVEDGLLARAFREAPVNAIWEGSGNVMCLDVLRVLAREPETAPRLIARWESVARGERLLAAALERLKAMLIRPAEADARALVEHLALVGAGVLLREHAPAAIAEGFIAARLGDHGLAQAHYGAAASVAEPRAILERIRFNQSH